MAISSPLGGGWKNMDILGRCGGSGLDMTASLIQHLFGAEAFEEATTLAEYQPQTDSTVDPFAHIYGLI